MAQNKPESALAIYDKSLKRNPRRLLSLEGKKSAAKSIGQKEVIVQVDLELKESLAQQPRQMIL